MDISRPKALTVVETVLSRFKFSQYQIWKQTRVSFGQVNRVVRFLIEKKAVMKVGKQYQVSSYGGVLQLFAAYRTFPKPTATFQVVGNPQGVLSYLAENGCTFCLTTAWQHYDDYLHDEAVHAYLPADAAAQEKILAELSGQPKGVQPIYLYLQDIPVEPVKVPNTFFKKSEPSNEPFSESIEPLKQLPVTSEIRTLLDMYSSNYAYGVQNWVTRKVEQ